MALTRKFLASKGLEAEVIEDIISAHTETVTGLKDQITEYEKYKADAEKLPAVQKELDKLKESIKDGAGAEYQTKYEAAVKEKEDLQKKFDAFKNEQAEKEAHANKEKAYQAILKDAGIPEKHFAKILKYSDIDGLELDKDGKIKTADDVLKSIKEEWADHIESNHQKGADVSNPPTNNGAKGGEPSHAVTRAMQYRNNLYGETKSE